MLDCPPTVGLIAVDRDTRRHIAKDSARRTESAFRATVEEGQRAGEIDDGRGAAAMAAWLLATVIGMRVPAKTAQDATRLERVVDAAMGSL